MTAPRLSIVVIVYKMARQAMNTLYSLSMDYQRNVAATDYEVIIIENRSSELLDPNVIAQLKGNFRYFLREETGVSPVPALNFGVQQTRGKQLGLMIDGARMVTPRVIENVLAAMHFSEHPLVAVPGYNIGPAEQQFHHEHQYDEQTESALLECIHWQTNGYRLFDIANLSGANPKGALQLFLECNCLFVSRCAFEDIGGADERFDLRGGGSINLHLYRTLGMHPLHQQYLVLAGEGSFHQFHGGVTTSHSAEREMTLATFRAQLESIWGGEFGGALKREPMLLGAINSHAQRFLAESSRKTQHRFTRMQVEQLPFWPDDSQFPDYSCSQS
jgi:hypothetical protein